jgi:hypothetical protein
MPLAMALMLPVASAAGATPPNLIFILADDLGHNVRPALVLLAYNCLLTTSPGCLPQDVGWANGRTITPHLDALAKGGLELTQWYVFKYCAPTRGMLNTGRFPFHFGFYNNQDANDYGVPMNYTFLPQALKQANYRTHAIGKWHMGFRSHGLTAIGRGYDTWLGYYHMAEDYFTHKQNVKLSGGCCPGCAGEYLDFSNASVEEGVNHPLTDQGGVYHLRGRSILIESLDWLRYTYVSDIESSARTYVPEQVLCLCVRDRIAAPHAPTRPRPRQPPLLCLPAVPVRARPRGGARPLRGAVQPERLAALHRHQVAAHAPRHGDRAGRGCGQPDRHV